MKKNNMFRTILIAVLGATYLLIGALVSFGQTPTGWATETGFRNAGTNVQKAIVARALAASGKKSGQSIATPSQGWQTDAADGDGELMMTAENRYIQWVRAPGSISRATLKNQIIADFGSSPYTSSQRQKMADQIMSVYGPFSNSYSISTFNATLAFMGIQKQCLEWAMTTAISAGGKAKNYGAAGVVDLSTIRPGMGLYETNKSHAMIIIDIYWDSTGKPTKVKVAEANYANEWSNPAGSIPWNRVVRTDRNTITLANRKVINYETP